MFSVCPSLNSHARTHARTHRYALPHMRAAPHPRIHAPLRARLTRTLVNALELSSTAGSFRNICQITLSIMRTNEDSVMVYTTTTFDPNSHPHPPRHHYFYLCYLDQTSNATSLSLEILFISCTYTYMHTTHTLFFFMKSMQRYRYDPIYIYIYIYPCTRDQAMLDAFVHDPLVNWRLCGTMYVKIAGKRLGLN